MLGAAGVVVPGPEAGAVDDGGTEAGAVDDGGVEDGGVDDGGVEDGGADECDAWAEGDPEPPGSPGKELTGTGGIDVLGPARAGVKNAFGATRAAAGGADEDPVRELGAGLDDMEAGEVATAPAPACGWRWLDAAGVWWLAPIRANAATAEPATSPPVRHTEASGREIRCRPGPPVPRRRC